MDIATLARPEILAMRPYESARSSMSADGILLNANEAPCTLVDEPEYAGLNLNRYPAPQPAPLVDRLAGLYGTRPEQVLVTRGSDEGIDLLVRVFCRPGSDAIAECAPCFGMYRIAAAIQGAAVVNVPRLADRDFGIDPEKLAAEVRDDERIRLVFLTSPGNPTGDGISQDVLVRLLEACADQALLVLDEAYIEFSGRPSAAGLLGRYPHLVLLRTLSKAWAAAGLRCGAVLADPVVIGLLRRVMAPYPLTAPAVEAAMRITDGDVAAAQRKMVAGVMERKAALLEFLENRQWAVKIWPGEANFVLLRVADAAGLVDWCGERGIRIRSFHGQPMLDNCIRLSVGNGAEMQALKRALSDYGKAV